MPNTSRKRKEPSIQMSGLLIHPSAVDAATNVVQVYSWFFVIRAVTDNSKPLATRNGCQAERSWVCFQSAAVPLSGLFKDS